MFAMPEFGCEFSLILVRFSTHSWHSSMYLCASISIRLNVSDIANELFRMCTLPFILCEWRATTNNIATNIPCTVCVCVCVYGHTHTAQLMCESHIVNARSVVWWMYVCITDWQVRGGVAVAVLRALSHVSVYSSLLCSILFRITFLVRQFYMFLFIYYFHENTVLLRERVLNVFVISIPYHNNNNNNKPFALSLCTLCIHVCLFFFGFGEVWYVSLFCFVILLLLAWDFAFFLKYLIC